MSIVLNKEFINYAEEKMSIELLRFSTKLSKKEAEEMAQKIVSSIDWENSALMHKGFSWIAKNYLKNN